MNKITQKIGFLGAGKMATALARGLISSGLCSPDQLLASDLSEAQRTAFEKETGVKTTISNQDVAAFAGAAILAVKPDHVIEVLESIRGPLSKGLLISIAAGVTIRTLEEGMGKASRVVRVMPNTPALVGCGASAFSGGQNATPEDLKLADTLLSAVGLAFAVPEKLLDAVTGLSGSGPAYVFLMIEALSDGGVEMGLPRDVATKLAAQTLLGSAKLLLESGKHPGELKDMVTSPGGTTIEGLHALEAGGLRAALMNAVKVSTEKAAKLGAK